MRAQEQTRTEPQTRGKKKRNDGQKSKASFFVFDILVAVLPVSCPATQLCSTASHLKASHIAFRTGLKHFVPLHLTLPASPSLNPLLPPQLLHARQSNSFGTGESFCMCERFHFCLQPLFSPSVHLKDYIKLYSKSCFTTMCSF